MESIETFTSPAGRAGLSRRQLLKLFAATAATAQLTTLGGGVPASAATPAWEPPPAYGVIVGLL